jgi:hypothetical protein
MTDQQLRAFPAFKTLPVYDESDARADLITTSHGMKVREATTMAEVAASLQNPRLVPLGGLRVGPVGQQVVVVYFGETT